jgi:DNA-binding NtrC family response regulator
MTTRHETRDFLGVEAVFASSAMHDVLAIAEKVAPTNATILINGESGCGKEVIARAIHHYSLRSAKSWVDINCAALPENLLESELFGHEKGAFSGADSSKPGLFEMADQGTLFLDEVGELDPRMQVKLLRVLDRVPYYRLGGVKKVSVDVRLIAATNQDLKAAVQHGRFRSDLYHRLCQIRLSVPPLRERRDDIVPLALHYLESEKPGATFSEPAVDLLLAYPWPGNVRELRNVVVRAAIMASGPQITVTDLPEELTEHAFAPSLQNLARLEDLERSVILKTLEETEGHQQTAANKLGISKRTLQRKIKGYRMTSLEEDLSMARVTP